ncbi:MAG: hypothetical protein NTX79_06255 [Candidatus Micrarchaeota archaeon]|nr:hypothetical protein [Candidatus Micrarchaeota archaeon]
MGPNFLQHQGFKVAKKFDNGGGITSPEASVRYGPTTKQPMLIFRDALILFADKRLFLTYEDKVVQTSPVHTRMKTLISKMPLTDLPEGELKIIKDGKTFFKVQEGGITELIQVDDRLLTKENTGNASQIIKAEQGWITKRIKKDKEYITYLLEGNDQMSIPILSKKFGFTSLNSIPEFMFNEKELREGAVVQDFLKAYGNLVTAVTYNISDANYIYNGFFEQKYEIAGGLASISLVFEHMPFFIAGAANIPQTLSYRPGVFVYSAAEGDKIDVPINMDVPSWIAAQPWMGVK